MLTHIFRFMVVCSICLTVYNASAKQESAFQIRLVSGVPTKNTVQFPVVKIFGRSDDDLKKLNIQKKVLIDGSDVKSVHESKVTFGNRTYVSVVIQFNKVGTKKFARISGNNIHRRLAIIVDGKICTAPVIFVQIFAGTVNISGDMTEKEAKELAAKINSSISKKYNNHEPANLQRHAGT